MDDAFVLRNFFSFRYRFRMFDVFICMPYETKQTKYIQQFPVDVIKPKPLPRNVINGNFTQANNASNNTALKSTTETTKTSTNNISTVSMKTTDSQNIPVNTTNAVAQIEPAKTKTESLIQRFSKISGNTDATPELKRIVSK